MTTFEIGTDFLLDQQPFKIYAGAIHYFRIAPGQWRYTLKKAKAAGLNTIETYVPWNMHEPVEQQFDFSGALDLKRFIKMAAEEDLYVIVRPSPYICAEWEFGGFPAWLLKYPDMIVRSNTPLFISKVAAYYHHLFQELVPLQVTHGGPILMMQVENEYGSFGNDKSYLRQIKHLMLNNGVDVPLFTSDGSWLQALEAGSLIEDGILATANFGSHAKENLTVLQQFFEQHDQKWPLMCMEFWDGWFSRWQEPVVQRASADFEHDLRELVDFGASFNLYMFRGGSNWGFWNGCSSRNNVDLPQVTSYDYDAILHEDGTENGKFAALQHVLGVTGEIGVAEEQAIQPRQLPSIAVQKTVRLVDVLDDLAQPVTSLAPQLMPAIGSGYGYIFYRTTVHGQGKPETLRLVDASDRADIYLNQQLLDTQYQATLGTDLTPTLEADNQLEILVENMGRVNYGTRLLSPTQKKGIRTGVVIDRHLHFGWQQWALDFKSITHIDWTKQLSNYGPTLNRFTFDLDQTVNTYLNCAAFGKGIVLVNGHHIGRYWSVGPIETLYVPSDFLNVGHNEIVVFETTTTPITQLEFTDKRMISE